jgi:hypothetical protein
MLFTSMVPQVFEQMKVDAYSLANTARKRETAKRLDFYFSEQLEYLEAQLAELFSDPSSMVRCHLNLVRKIINQLAQVYRTPPARTIEGGSDKDKTIYKEIMEQCQIDTRMKVASRFAKLLKTILLRPVWRNNRLDLDILTGDFVDVITGDTPEQLLEVLITDYGPSGKIEDVTFSHWTAESWRRLDHNGNILEQAENPYGVLPFLPVFDYPPTGSTFWLPGGSDLFSIAEAVNLKLTDLLHLLAQQSFGVGFIKGSSGGANLRVDPGTMIELPENGEIGFRSQEAQIGEVVNAIDKLVKWACVSQGLSAASMSTDLSDRQSGYAKTIDLLEMSESRQDDLPLWRNYEKQLFQLMRVVWNTHNPTKKLSDSCTLAIDFSDPRPAASPKEQAEAWDMQLAMGVISPVDVCMSLNADFQTREDALAHLLKLKEETQALNS